MSRIIHTEGGGKERNALLREVVYALRALMSQGEVTTTTRDIVAYLILVLEAVAGTVEKTVEAWEKRDYWIKADRYRLEWQWTTQYAQKLRSALQPEDWNQVAQLAIQIGGKCSGVNMPKRKRTATPWDGAWGRLNLGRKAGV
ncbi:MAG: hypothetical protein PHS96_10095 [Anaerolineales bacterium]|nr:hypothetical protein [Anaerolineales bacterium]